MLVVALLTRVIGVFLLLGAMLILHDARPDGQAAEAARALHTVCRRVQGVACGPEPGWHPVMLDRAFGVGIGGLTLLLVGMIGTALARQGELLQALLDARDNGAAGLPALATREPAVPALKPSPTSPVAANGGPKGSSPDELWRWMRGGTRAESPRANTTVADQPTTASSTLAPLDRARPEAG